MMRHFGVCQTGSLVADWPGRLKYRRRRSKCGRSAFLSHLEGKCKDLKRLQLSGCWGDSHQRNLIVTRSLTVRSTARGEVEGSPWHSGASLPPCRPLLGASRSFSLGGWGVPGFGRRMQRGGLAAEEDRRLGSARGALLPLSGTPGSDHVAKLGKARRMPNTSAWRMCRRPASGIDLTLARRIGRNWTRPVGRGNIALLGRQEQTYRAFANEDLCVCRRHGRAGTHTFRGNRPRVIHDSSRGLRRTSLGAR